MFNVYSYDKIKKVNDDKKDPEVNSTAKGSTIRRDKLARNHQERVKKFMIEVSCEFINHSRWLIIQ